MRHIPFTIGPFSARGQQARGGGVVAGPAVLARRAGAGPVVQVGEVLVSAVRTDSEEPGGTAERDDGAFRDQFQRVVYLTDAVLRHQVHRYSLGDRVHRLQRHRAEPEPPHPARRALALQRAVLSTTSAEDPAGGTGGGVHLGLPLSGWFVQYGSSGQ